MESEREEKGNNEGITVVAAILAVVAVVAAVIPYLPQLILGFGLSLFIYYSKFQRGLHLRIRAYVGSIVSMSLVTAILFGAPLLKEGKGFQGIISDWKPLQHGLASLYLEWVNMTALTKELSRAPIFRKMPSAELLNHFVWTTVLIGVVLSSIYFVVGYLRKGAKQKRSKAMEFLGTLGWRSVEMMFWPFFTFWAYQSSGKWGTSVLTWRRLIALVIGSLAISSIGKWATHSFPFTNFAIGVSFVTALPFWGTLIGFILVKIPNALYFVSWLLGYQKAKGDLSESSFLLGKTAYGDPVCLTDRNLGYHVEIVAPSGSGKTNIIKNLIEDRIARGHGVFFLDLKGDFDVAMWLYRAGSAYGRAGDLRLLSISNRNLSVPYNPIKTGSATEIHSQIMSALTWSEDYYKKVSSIALMTLVRGLSEYRDKTGELFHLGHLHELLDRPGAIRKFNEKLRDIGSRASYDMELLAERLDRPSEKKELTGLIAGLNQLRHSAAGPLICEDVVGGSYDLGEALDGGRITYFLMNSLILKESAAVFGKMVLQDLMSFVGNRYAQIERKEEPKPVTLIIDEFASFATPEFIEFLDRARGAGIGIIMAHQARADLRQVSPEFQERVEANSNTTIVSGVKSSDDAEHYAGMVGTDTTTKETRQIDRSRWFFHDTGMSSVRETEEYKVHPNLIKGLEQGEAFVISRTVDSGWALVRIPIASEFSNISADKVELEKHFMGIRQSYLTSNREKYLALKAEEPVSGLKVGPEVGRETKEKRAHKGAHEPELWN